MNGSVRQTGNAKVFVRCRQNSFQRLEAIQEGGSADFTDADDLVELGCQQRPTAEFSMKGDGEAMSFVPDPL